MVKIGAESPKLSQKNWGSVFLDHPVCLHPMCLSARSSIIVTTIVTNYAVAIRP